MPNEDLVVRARLRDELSRGLVGINTELKRTSQTLRQLNAEEAAANGQRVSSSNLLDKQAGALRNVGSAANDSRIQNAHQAFKKLDNSVQSASSAVTNLAGRLARDLVIGIGVAGAAIVGFGLKSASQFQQTRIALDGFLGSAQAGGDMFKQLQALNLKTPFQLGDIATGAKELLGFQINAAQVVPLMKSITDVGAGLGGTPEVLDRIILNLGQIQSIGKTTGRDLRDLATLGVPSYALVANILGKTKEEVQAMGDQASVSSEQFINAFINMQGPLQMFSGMAEKQMSSLRGLWSNIVDIFQVNMVNATQPLVQQLMPIIGPGGPLTVFLREFTMGLGPGIAHIAGDFLNLFLKGLIAIEPVLDVFIRGLGRLLDAAMPAFGGMGPVIDQLVTALGGFFDALIPVMPDLVRLFIALVGILPSFIELLTAFIPLIDPVANLLTTLLKYDFVKDGLAALLLVLMGYNVLHGLAEGVWAFTTAIQAMGASALTAAPELDALAVSEDAAATAGGAGGLGMAGKLGAAGAGAAGIGGAYYGASHNGIGSDLAEVGGFAATGAALGSVIPGAGTVAGGLIGAGVGGVGVLIKHNTGLHAPHGDPTGTLHRSMSRFAAFDAATPGQRTVTSTLRNFGLASASSGHARGTAIDASGSHLQTLRNNINRGGGWATVHDVGSGQHLHGEFGDAMPIPRAMATVGAATDDSLRPIHVEVYYPTRDVDVAVAVQQGLKLAERDKKERG